MSVIIYAKAVLPHYWALLGSAAFTTLGFVGDNYTQLVRPISWSLAALLLLVAGYKAWAEEHKKYESERAKNVRPKIKV